MFPLNKDWAKEERNLNLLKLGQFIHRETQDPLTTRRPIFDHQKYVASLDYLDLYSPPSIIPDPEIRQDVNQVLVQKEREHQQTTSQSQDVIENKSSKLSKKRDRTTFEDSSLPRILNNDERMQSLKTYQQTNKVASQNASEKKTKKTKTTDYQKKVSQSEQKIITMPKLKNETDHTSEISLTP